MAETLEQIGKSNYLSNYNLDELVATCLVEVFHSGSPQPADHELVHELIERNGLPQFIEDLVEKIKLETDPERLFITQSLLMRSTIDAIRRLNAVGNSSMQTMGEDSSSQEFKLQISSVLRLFNTVLIRQNVLGLENQPPYFSSLKRLINDVSDMVFLAKNIWSVVGNVDDQEAESMVSDHYLYEKLCVFVAIFSQLNDEQKKRAMGIFQKSLDYYHVHLVVEMILEYLGPQEYEVFDRRLTNRFGVVREPEDILNKRSYLDEAETSDGGEPQLLSRGKLQLKHPYEGEAIIVEMKEHSRPVN